MFQQLLDMLYPVRCPVCQEIVVPKGQRICTACKDKLQVIGEPRCMKCGKPVEYEEQEYCRDCVRREFHFIKGWSVWVYDAAMKKSISDYKYQSKKENAKFYIEELLRLYGDTLRKLAPDALVPIPVHKHKYRERGYNQADILARGIGRELEIPVLSHLLIRSRKTLPQKQLDDKERLRNLREAFRFNSREEKMFHKKINRVLLVDDIFTTGSTMEACTNLLMEHGVNEIFFITLCIGKGY